MKKMLFVAAASVAGVASAAQASGCGSPFCQGGGHYGHRMPAFQAAPWYLYWPYNQHFMTPAPMQGAYSAPPGSGYGGLTNPYFPGGGMPGGGYSYPQSTPSTYTPPTTPGGGPYTPPAPPAPMPQAPGVTPPGAIPPGVIPPTGTPPPVTPPLGTPPPAGTTPPVTPGVSAPIIPAIPGLIRAAR